MSEGENKLQKSLRTMTFVPGYMTKFLEKAVDFASDALILDLEDSVPDEYKEQARKNIKQFLEAGVYKQQVYIRVNAIDSGLLGEDLRWTAHKNTDGFMFTKINNEKDILFFDKLLGQLEKDKGFEDKKFKMCPLIETTSAVLRAYDIGIASPRMIALVFGAEDYLNDLHGLHKEEETSLLVPRSLIAIAARAAKIEAIDATYLNIHDLEGFKKRVDLARELGFSGNLIIHPTQIAVANKGFLPSAEEIEEARKIVAAIEKSKKKGLGVTLLDGKLIGPPMEKRAIAILQKVDGIEYTKTREQHINK